MFCSTISQKKKKKYKTHVCFTFGSPSDDAQSTSERKREHPPLSSRRPAAFPQGISLRESEGELLGSEAPLSEHYPCWHVHFLTGGKGKKTGSVPFLRLSPSRRHCSLCLSCCFHVLLPLWRTSSPFRWVLSKPLQKTGVVVFLLNQHSCPFLPQTSFAIHFL